MLMRRQWPIAALAERHCARTVHVPCGAPSIARNASQRGWKALWPQPLPDSFLARSLRLRLGRFPHRLLREAAADPTRPSPEFWPDSFPSASVPYIRDNTPRDWRILPFLFCSSPGRTPATADTAKLWESYAASALPSFMSTRLSIRCALP